MRSACIGGCAGKAATRPAFSIESLALFVDPTLRAHLEARGVPFCVIGAVALGAHGFVRTTADVDLLTTDEGVLEKTFWPSQPDEIHRGERDERLAGTVPWLGGIPHDLIVARGHAARVAMETAQPDPSVDGCPVATPWRSSCSSSRRAAPSTSSTSSS